MQLLFMRSMRSLWLVQEDIKINHGDTEARRKRGNLRPSAASPLWAGFRPAHACRSTGFHPWTSERAMAYEWETSGHKEWLGQETGHNAISIHGLHGFSPIFFVFFAFYGASG